MRRHPPEYLTFCEGLAHEAEFQMLEVAPPWINLVAADEVPLAKSACSQR